MKKSWTNLIFPSLIWVWNYFLTFMQLFTSWNRNHKRIWIRICMTADEDPLIQDTDPHDNQCFYVQNFYKKLNLPVPGTWDSTVYVVVQFKCGKQLLIYLSSEIKLTCLVWPSCWQQQRTAVGQQLTSPHHHSCGATYQGLSHGQHSPTWHHELQKWDLKPIWTYAISTIADLF